MERVQHVNRIKDYSSLRAHPSMSRCVAIGERGWMRFRPAMAVAPQHLKADPAALRRWRRRALSRAVHVFAGALFHLTQLIPSQLVSVASTR
jgi:hypothetical protein